MKREWVLDTMSRGVESGALRLRVKDARSGATVDLSPPCSSSEQFAEEVSRIKAELDGLVEDVRNRFAATAEKDLDPRDVWRKMEALGSEGEMFEYFNAFHESARAKIAEYVLTKVNMFKGRGPIFSEHYDSSSHLLD